MAPSKNELIDSAQRFVQKGQLDRAIKEYEQVLKLDAGDIQTRLRLGDVYAKKGAAREAIDQYLRVADRHASDGFYLKAIAVHKQILRLDPSFIDSSSRLADLYRKQGLLSDALQTYQQVAAAYDRQGDVRAALDTLTKMADLDSHNVAIRVKLGEMYLKANIRESGIEQLVKAAELLGKAGKQAEQVKVLDRVLVSGPSAGPTTRAVLAMLVEAGEVETALKRLGALVARSPDDPDLRELQAAALLKAGRSAEAREGLEAALAAAPHALACRRRLVELHVDAGDVVAAAGAAAGFVPETLPAAKLAEAVDVVRALATQDPPLPPEVRAALQRALVALCAARGDAAGQEAAQAALAEAVAEAGDLGGSTIDAGGGTLDLSGADLTGDTGLASGAELTLDIDPSEGLRLDSADGALTLDAAAPVDSRGVDPALAAPPAGASALAGGAGGDDPLGLSLDLDEPGAGHGVATVDQPSVDRWGGDMALDGPLDAAPPDTSSMAASIEVSIDPPGDDIPLDGPGVGEPAAETSARRSPEREVLAAGGVELSLDQIPEELDEAEFFVQQGLVEAARAIYRRVLAVDPDHPQARKAMVALGRSSGDPASGAPGPSHHADGAPFDLAAVLAGPLGGEAGGVLADAEEQVSFQEVFREFKQGVERQVGDDPEVHYNLGIAYKEMGLVDDALGEFERALADPGRRFDCYAMIGLCQLQRGDPEAAVAAFEAGLQDPGLPAARTAALTYDLGLAYEAAGRADEARTAFARVARWDPNFRDVAAKTNGAHGAFDPQSLLADDPDHRQQPSARAGAARGNGAPRRRDKISFV